MPRKRPHTFTTKYDRKKRIKKQIKQAEEHQLQLQQQQQQQLLTQPNDILDQEQQQQQLQLHQQQQLTQLNVMSHINVCRLCLNVCSDCKSLYCASGQTNEIYDITVKYFHTKFLNVDQDNQNTVICLECWHHISDFHSFQQSVVQAQTKLLKEESFMEYKCSIQSTHSRENASCSSITIKKENEDEDTGCSILIKEEYEASMPNLEFMEELSYCNTLQTVKNEDNTYNKPDIKTEDSENIGTIPNLLYNANEEDPSITNAYKSEESANLVSVPIGLYSGEYEVVNEAEELSEQSNAAECLSLADGSMNSHGSQQINTYLEPRRQKTQYELDTSISEWREYLECVQCGMMVTSFALLQKHFRQEHPTEECYITCCDRKFRTCVRTAEHARFHNDPSAFKCPKCDLRLSDTASLYKHKRICLSDSKQPRKPLKKKSYTKTPLNKIDKFIAIYKPNLECEICHQTYKRFTQLKIHFQQKHPDNDFYVMCCQSKFYKRSQLREHVWIHLDPNAFKCDICGKNNSTYYGLQSHMIYKHAITLELKSIDDIGDDIQRSLYSSLKDNANQ